LPPLLAQQIEQARRQHRVAVFPPFARFHPDHHPLAVDVLWAQR
jgi:hypothetical protein